MRNVIAVAIVALAGWGCAAPPAADLVIVNAKVFTPDPARPWAEAVAVRGDRVVAVGSRSEVETSAGTAARRLDAGGRTLIPGINDAHVHVSLAPEAFALTLNADPDLPQVDAALAAAVSSAPPDRLIRGTIGPAAWDDGRLTRAWLDAKAPGRAVWLEASTGHGLVLSSAALSLAGISEDSTAPEGGRYGRDAAGRLDGRLEEYAGYMAARALAGRLDRTAAASRYRMFSAEAVTYGITSAHLMSDARPVAETVAHVLAAQSPIRWRILRFPTRQPGEETRDSRPHLPPQPSLTMDVRGMKWILDGTPVERLAYMTREYADAAGQSGRMNFAPERLQEFVRWAYGSEDLLAVHAVGDAAIEAYITAVEKAGLATVWQRKRPRIEHGDFMTAAQRARAAKLGMVVVQNPAHLTLRDVFAQRVGAARLEELQSLKSLLTDGVPLALGSDGVLNPYLNILWASTHPVNPAEALTREQAVTAYTRGSSYAEFTERDKGHLSPGAPADLAILSGDPFTAAAERMEGIRSVLTVIGGRVVHDTGVVRATSGS